MKSVLSLVAVGVVTFGVSACGTSTSHTAGSGSSSPSMSVATSATSTTSSAASSPSSATAPAAPAAPKVTTVAAPAPAPVTVTNTVVAPASSAPAAASGATVPAPSEAQADQALTYYYSDASKVKDCSTGGVHIEGVNISCGFAHNVAAAFEASNSHGPHTIEAYSPATHTTYGLYCSSGAHGSTCSTSRNATVWMEL